MEKFGKIIIGVLIFLLVLVTYIGFNYETVEKTETYEVTLKWDCPHVFNSCYHMELNSETSLDVSKYIYTKYDEGDNVTITMTYYMLGDLSLHRRVEYEI